MNLINSLNRKIINFLLLKNVSKEIIVCKMQNNFFVNLMIVMKYHADEHELYVQLAVNTVEYFKHE